MVNQQFNVRLEMGTAAWAYLHLELGGKSHRVRFSRIFAPSPFVELTDWGRRVSVHDAAECEFNEEGFFTALTSQHADNLDHVLLRAWDPLENATFLEGYVSRSHLIDSLKTEILRFFENEFDANEWQPDVGEPPVPGWTPVKDRVLGNPWFKE